MEVNDKGVLLVSPSFWSALMIRGTVRNCTLFSRIAILLTLVFHVEFRLIFKNDEDANQHDEIIHDHEALSAESSYDRMSDASKQYEDLVMPLSGLVSPQPLCSRHQVRNGTWHSIRLDSPPYIPPDQLKCGSSDSYHQSYYHSYQWRPHDKSCDFTTWDSAYFCKLLNNQSLVFMGDSLSQEAMYAVGELLGLRTSADDFQESPIYNWSAACHGSVRLSFRRDDKLNPDKVAWELRDREPNVVVLNRGAHSTKDDRLLRELNQTLVHIHDWQQRCRKGGVRCLLVWRTSVPGHPKCGKFHQPTTDRAFMERLVQNTPRSRGYGWHEFQRQNLLIEQVLHDSMVHYEMLDAYDVNILRPDSHRDPGNDCLHNCLGSKLDVYAQLLLHLLRREYRVKV